MYLMSILNFFITSLPIEVRFPDWKIILATPILCYDITVYLSIRYGGLLG
jgi:hypothetical protein